MTTKELSHLTSLDPAQQRLVLALGIVMDRLSRLSKDESDVALELFKDFASAETPEDRAAADAAIMELLENRPVTVGRMDLVAATPDASNKLQKWKTWVSARIKDCRSKKNMTQEQLAEATGLPQSHISRIENAIHSPSQVTLEKIAKALDQPVTVFDPSAGEEPCK